MNLIHDITVSDSHSNITPRWKISSQRKRGVQIILMTPPWGRGEALHGLSESILSYFVKCGRQAFVSEKQTTGAKKCC